MPNYAIHLTFEADNDEQADVLHNKVIDLVCDQPANEDVDHECAFGSSTVKKVAD